MRKLCVILLSLSLAAGICAAAAGESAAKIRIPEGCVISADAFDGCTLEYVEAQGDYCRKWCKEHNIKIYEPDPNETEINTDF